MKPLQMSGSLFWPTPSPGLPTPALLMPLLLLNPGLPSLSPHPVAPLTAAFLVCRATLFARIELSRDTQWWPFLCADDSRLHTLFLAALSLRALEINIEEYSRAEITPIVLKAPVIWTCSLGTMEGFLSRFLASIFLPFVPSCFHPIPYGICQILYS